MKFRHLRIFTAVCETMSMTKAARHLYISQPAVSQTITELEEYYDVRLFERMSNKLYLTDAGKQLLPLAQEAMKLQATIETTMRDFRQENSIRLGATVTIGTYLLPRVVKAIQSIQPQIRVQTVVDNTSAIEEKLLNSDLDIGLVEGQITSSQLVTEPFYEDELVIVCAPNHPLAGKDLVRVRDLQNHAFILREEGSGSRLLFSKRMEEKSITYRIVGVLSNTEAILNSAQQGLGLGVVSRIAVAVEQPGLKVLNIPDLNLTRTFDIVYHRHKSVKNALTLTRSAVDLI
jgi:DNA-binding transcriptional LysR family regulator